MALSLRLAPALALLTLLPACSGSISETQTAPTSATVEAATVGKDGSGDGSPEDSAPAAEGERAPEPTTTVQQPARPYELPYELEFTAILFDGSSLEGADVARQNVLFWFWTPT
ncbi:MAG: hypothetical protein CL442_01415 [Acidimicrobiaceae bacterium]|nr:hypothetical protein [Acidimicrobiaceae bacterium]|tara:strand:- start:61 stop:402 length:342 start_codon:yes stop_codon:yes gene_type:complete